MSKKNVYMISIRSKSRLDRKGGVGCFHTPRVDKRVFRTFPLRGRAAQCVTERRLFLSPTGRGKPFNPDGSGKERP